MGRLSHFIRLARRWYKRNLPRSVRSWILPMMLSLGIIFGVHTQVQADPAPSVTELQQYLQSNQLAVRSETVDGYQQIFYYYDGQKVFLTSAAYNHKSPMASGQYVVWEGIINGFTQIFMYDVLSQSLTQITSVGVNVSPFVYQNTVTWQHWDGNGWQIKYYDSSEVITISDGERNAVYGTSNGDQVLYAEQLGADLWEAKAYTIDTQETEIIRQGNTASTAFPRFVNGEIKTDFVAQ